MCMSPPQVRQNPVSFQVLRHHTKHDHIIIYSRLHHSFTWLHCPCNHSHTFSDTAIYGVSITQTFSIGTDHPYQHFLWRVTILILVDYPLQLFGINRTNTSFKHLFPPARDHPLQLLSYSQRWHGSSILILPLKSNWPFPVRPLSYVVAFFNPDLFYRQL